MARHRRAGGAILDCLGENPTLGSHLVARDALACLPRDTGTAALTGPWNDDSNAIRDVFSGKGWRGAASLDRVGEIMPALGGFPPGPEMTAWEVHHGNCMECLLVEIGIAAAPPDLEIADSPLLVKPHAHDHTSS